MIENWRYKYRWVIIAVICGILIFISWYTCMKYGSKKPTVKAVSMGQCDTITCTNPNQWTNVDYLYIGKCAYNIYRRTYGLTSGGMACDTVSCPNPNPWQNTDLAYIGKCMYLIYLRTFQTSSGNIVDSIKKYAWLQNGNSFSTTTPYFGINTANDFVMKINSIGFGFFVNGTSNGNMGWGVQAGGKYYTGLLTGTGNTMIGRASCNQMTSGSFNTFNGYGSGVSMTNGSENSFFGEGSGAGIENGANYNWGIGFQPMGNTAVMGAASYNGALGNAALYNINNGKDNIGIGDSAGFLLSNNNNCLAIGAQAGKNGGTFNHAIAFGYHISFKASNTANFDSLITDWYISGNLHIQGAGNGIEIATGTNATAGQATLSSGTFTVVTSAVKANSLIFCTPVNTAGTTNVGQPVVTTITASTSFIITSTNLLDNSKVNWFIINQP